MRQIDRSKTCLAVSEEASLQKMLAQRSRIAAGPR